MSNDLLITEYNLCRRVRLGEGWHGSMLCLSRVSKASYMLAFITGSNFDV